MFWITETHFLFVGLFDWLNAETQTSLVSQNQDGFALAESRTRKSGTVTTLPLIFALFYQFYNSWCLMRLRQTMGSQNL